MRHFVPLALVAALLVGLFAIHPLRAQTTPTDTADSLTLRLARPVSATRDAHATLYTLTLSSSGWIEFPATDIPAARRTANNAQEIVVEDIDTAAKVCVMQKARSSVLVDGGPTPDCGKLLDAGITLETCASTSGTASDYLLSPGSSQPVNAAGDDCIFLRSDTANGDVYANDVVR